MIGDTTPSPTEARQEAAIRNALVLMRNTHTKAILLVEGPTDEHFWRQVGREKAGDGAARVDRTQLLEHRLTSVALNQEELLTTHQTPEGYVGLPLDEQDRLGARVADEDEAGADRGFLASLGR